MIECKLSRQHIFQMWPQLFDQLLLVQIGLADRLIQRTRQTIERISQRRRRFGHVARPGCLFQAVTPVVDGRYQCVQDGVKLCTSSRGTQSDETLNSGVGRLLGRVLGRLGLMQNGRGHSRSGHSRAGTPCVVRTTSGG